MCFFLLLQYLHKGLKASLSCKFGLLLYIMNSSGYMLNILYIFAELAVTPPRGARWATAIAGRDGLCVYNKYIGKKHIL